MPTTLPPPDAVLLAVLDALADGDEDGAARIHAAYSLATVEPDDSSDITESYTYREYERLTFEYRQGLTLKVVGTSKSGKPVKRWVRSGSKAGGKEKAGPKTPTPDTATHAATARGHLAKPAGSLSEGDVTELAGALAALSDDPGGLAGFDAEGAVVESLTQEEYGLLSEADRSHLVKRLVTVRGKSGKSYQTTRWVRVDPPAGDHATNASLAGAVRARKLLGGGVNTTEVVTLADGSKAVWKPAAGEATGYRTNIPDRTQYKREAAAAAAAGLLGLGDLMPPTVLREIDGQPGSVQAFLPDTSQAARVTNPFDGDTDLKRAAAFDYVIGQTDRHDGNWLLTDKPGGFLQRADTGLKKLMSAPVEGDKIKLIDNGLSLPVAESSKDFMNQDLLRQAAKKNHPLPDLSAWEGKRGELEKSLTDAGIEPEAVKLAGDRLDAAVAASKAGRTFGDLPYAGKTVREGLAEQVIGARVIRL